MSGGLMRDKAPRSVHRMSCVIRHGRGGAASERGQVLQMTRGQVLPLACVQAKGKT
jgi:hypothetical protein